MSITYEEEDRKDRTSRIPYEPPKIIYKGKISTRAGSPLSGGTGTNGPDPSVADPADLFGNN